MVRDFTICPSGFKNTYNVGTGISEKINSVKALGVDHTVLKVVSVSEGLPDLNIPFTQTGTNLEIDLSKFNFFTNIDFELVWTKVENEDLINCAPGEAFEPTENLEQLCLQRGCDFDPLNVISPKCYYPKDFVSHEFDKTVTEPPFLLKNVRREAAYSTPFDNLLLDFEEISDNVVRIVIKAQDPPKGAQYEVDFPEVERKKTTVNKKYSAF